MDGSNPWPTLEKWHRTSRGLSEATENARSDIARPSELWELISRDWTTRHQIKQWCYSTVKSNMLNDKRIKSCLSRVDSGAYSRLQFLRAVSHSVGAHMESLQPRDDNSSSSGSEDEDEDSEWVEFNAPLDPIQVISEDEDRQAPVPAATTSVASESATAAAATTSDDCCEVCFVAPRAGFAQSHWCHVDMRGSVKRVLWPCQLESWPT